MYVYVYVYVYDVYGRAGGRARNYQRAYYGPEPRSFTDGRRLRDEPPCAEDSQTGRRRFRDASS